MNTRENRINSRSKQQGAALIVGLVILAVVTVLGITSMQSSNTELKLASSMRDRGVAFEAAEAALSVVEQQYSNVGGVFPAGPPTRDSLINSCTGATCFKNDCRNNGLCFAGSFDAADDQIYCEVADLSGAVRRTEFWTDPVLNVWDTDSRHQTITVDGVTNPVKYIVEFLCFVERSPELSFSTLDGERNNGAALFRITALAEGNGGRAKVALQSTYKVIN